MEARQAAALPKSVLQAARNAAASGHAGAAESLYRRAAALDTDNPDIYAELGDLLLRRGASDEAAATYRAAIRLDGRNADALYGLGRAQILLDEPQAAANSFSAANAAAPTVRGYNGLGVALDMTGAHAAAQEAYGQGLDLDPEYLGLRNNLGLSQILSGRHEEAVSTLRQAASHPLATPRERQNLALALGLSENPRLAARIGRLDLTEDQVADNLALYNRLRDGPDRSTLTALRRDRGGLAAVDPPQTAKAAAQPTESASVVPFGRVPKATAVAAKPVRSTPAQPAMDTADQASLSASQPSLSQAGQSRAQAAPGSAAAAEPVPDRSAGHAAATEAEVSGQPLRSRGPSAPTRDPHPSLSTKDVAVPMQFGEPGVSRGSARGASPHPAPRTSVWSAPESRTKPGQQLALSAVISPDVRPTVVASNAPGRTWSTAGWIDAVADFTHGWGVALGLLFAALIALHLVISRQIRDSERSGKFTPAQTGSVEPTRSAPVMAATQGSICGDEEVALINALLAGEGPLIEQAQHCRRLMEDFGYSAAVLAQLLGKSPGHVASMARLVGWQNRLSGPSSGSAASPETPEPPPAAPSPQPAS